MRLLIRGKAPIMHKSYPFLPKLSLFLPSNCRQAAKILVTRATRLLWKEYRLELLPLHVYPVIVFAFCLCHTCQGKMCHFLPKTLSILHIYFWTSKFKIKDCRKDKWAAAQVISRGPRLIRNVRNAILIVRRFKMNSSVITVSIERNLG